MNLLLKIKGILHIPVYDKSETSKVRHLVLPYCNGYGADVGFGGDKIKKDAVGIDLAVPYTRTGKDKVDIVCDLSKEKIPVPDNTYDYVYSSHLIEDFEDTAGIIREFVRILKPSGNLVLVFPDQFEYEVYCRDKKQLPNPHHIHPNMGLWFMLLAFERASQYNFQYKILYENVCLVDYNVIFVVKIVSKII